MGDSKPRNCVRCPHCAGPLSKEMETSDWTVAPLIRDSFSMIGSAVGGTASAFYGFNHVMPIVRRWVKGPMWLHFLVGCRTYLFMDAGPTSDSFLFSLCRISRWCCSSTCSACIFILSCSCLNSVIAASVLAGWEDKQIENLLPPVRISSSSHGLICQGERGRKERDSLELMNREYL